MEVRRRRRRSISTDDDSWTPDDEPSHVVHSIDDVTRQSFAAKVKLYLWAFWFHISQFLPQSVVNQWRARISPARSTPIEVKKLTPLELFEQHLENEDYEEALKIAKKNGLDADRVYKTQWETNNITEQTIGDYLSKVGDRSYVIQECVTRIPDDINSARALLQYGLKMSNLESVIALENGNEFALPQIDTDEEEETSLRGEQYKNYIKKKLKEMERKMVTSIDFENLSLESKQICIWRKKLLRYLDRLKIYADIISDSNEFDASFFRHFRLMSPFKASIHFARCSNQQAVSTIMKAHPDETEPHRIAIVSNFPETTPPDEYQSILPYIEINRTMTGSLNTKQDEDWVEEHCQHLKADFGDLEFETEFYMANQSLLNYKTNHLTIKLLTEWYSERVCEIESLTGIVRNALQLIKLAIEKNIPQLKKLQDELQTFSTLIYEVNASPFMTFESWRKMSNSEKVTHLMCGADVDEQRFVKHIKLYLLPFIKMCARLEEQPQDTNLLRDYLVSIAKYNLSLCFKVYEESKFTDDKLTEHDPPDKVINNIYDLMEYAIDCVYACEDINQLDYAFKIVECLPQRNEAGNDKRLSDLNDRVDMLEKHLIVTDILDQQGSRQLPIQIRDLQMNRDTEGTIRLFTKVTRNAGKRTQPNPMIVNDWIGLFKDLLDVYEMCLSDCITEDQLYEIFVETLLSSAKKENFKLAATYMQLDSELKPKKRQIPYDRSIQLLINAIREYVDSSNSVEDENISLAKECLNLIEEKEKQRNVRLIQEIDFIDSLYILRHDFPVKLLPVQVRLVAQPKMELIERALKSFPKAYKKTFKLLKLARLLKVYDECSSEFRDGKVLALIGENAFEKKDYNQCFNICQMIMKDDLSVSWQLCQTLGMCDAYDNDEGKLELLSFALTCCDDQIGSRLEEMINGIRAIRLRLVNKAVDEDEAVERENEKAQMIDAQMAKQKVTKTAQHLASWITNTFDKVVAATKSIYGQEDKRRGNSISIPAFYSDIYCTSSNSNISRLDIDYTRYAMPNIAPQLQTFVMTQHQIRAKMLKCSAIQIGEEQCESLNELFQKASCLSLFEDTPLSLMYALQLTHSHQVEQVFMRYETPIKSYFLTKILLYCLALRYLLANQTEEEPQPSDQLFQHDMNEVVLKAYENAEMEKNKSENALYLIKYFRLYDRILSEMDDIDQD